MNLLDERIWFPAYEQTHTSGIIAVGGDLSVERLKLAYQLGVFPWYNENEPILWWFPNPRFVLFPSELIISKSMAKLLRNQILKFTEDQCFEEVIDHCQKIKRPGQNGTWINEEMKKAYIELHHAGIAKSIEVWQNDELVGGFYGVIGKNIFCGESMFAKVPNASKAGFIHFVQKYNSQYHLIDCQVYTSHLASLGARNIEAEAFLTYLI
ncbi:MAG: leucyl/phenylalanyl-tRNA--protein transferase [Moheibacter sp.]